MSNILISSETEKKEFNTLIDKKIPHYRQAYSDRTCWIMACMSELVYIKFNKPFFDTNNTRLIDAISSLIDDKKIESLKKLYENYAYDSEKELEKLVDELKLFNMSIDKTFDKNGSQAMIVASDTYYILAFRGTEVSSLKDIKSDLDAKTIVCESGGKVHEGFHKAFDELHVDIQEYLDENLHEKKPLFITGHSLGAALATIGAKRLTCKHGIAACYTFGSPRVGDEEWMKGIKTPIYRLVNAADPVTMLPPGADTINATAWLAKFIPYVGDQLSSYLLSNFSGYYHAGYMRYLTHVDNSDYKQSELLYSATFFRRTKAYFFNKLSLKSIPADHSISVYRKKLKFIALDRNKE